MSSYPKTPTLKLDAKALGVALAVRRVRAKLSQEDAAERLGLGQEAVSRLERGVVVPSLQRLFEFANAYGCGVDEFILPISVIPSDQALWLSKRLEELRPSDRDFVVEMVEKICDRLKH